MEIEDQKRIVRRGNFIMTPYDIVKDPMLTENGLRILLHIMAYKPEWKLHENEVKYRLSSVMGDTKFRSGWKNLKDINYLTCKRYRDKGRIVCEWKLNIWAFEDHISKVQQLDNAMENGFVIEEMKKEPIEEPKHRYTKKVKQCEGIITGTGIDELDPALMKLLS